MLGQCLRCVRGIDVNEDTVSIETMKDVCMGGPGHYLGHAQTLSVMQTEYIYPRLGDRTSPKEWVEIGKPDLVQKAIEMKAQILEAPRRQIIDVLADAEIRQKFKIHLPADQATRAAPRNLSLRYPSVCIGIDRLAK